MYERILVGTDGSDGASNALSHALDVGAAVDATVYVVTVVESTANSTKFGVSEAEAIDDAANKLIEEVLTAYDDHDVEIHGDVRYGRPPEALLAFADEIDASLIVVGQRGADGVAGLLLGSTADRLARGSDVPVTVVPADPA